MPSGPPGPAKESRAEKGSKRVEVDISGGRKADSRRQLAGAGELAEAALYRVRGRRRGRPAGDETRRLFPRGLEQPLDAVGQIAESWIEGEGFSGRVERPAP